uniref:ACB domain-containing protein n=1 Tax=Araucaria cunninghamii TaxID=56994 RepID=A0A0D6QT57_ARACU
MARQTSPEFDAAVKASSQLSEKPSNDDLLAMYALFKQASQDPPIESAEKVGMFDLKGKAKRGAWQKIVDEGVTPEEAEQKYIALIEKMKETYKYDPSKAPEKVGK